MRQVVLDTETTGLAPEKDHRIIEIGAVEIINRSLTGRHYHQYINPEREIDAGAEEVHGISLDQLRDKPVFADIREAFLEYVDGAELIIHNAAFDIGFLDHELRREHPGDPGMAARCGIIDTLLMARKRHPGKANSLDALCRRYEVDNTNRVLHGALVDADLLARVYLRMTGGQTRLSLGSGEDEDSAGVITAATAVEAPNVGGYGVSAAELKAHEQWLDRLGEQSVWRHGSSAGAR